MASSNSWMSYPTNCRYFNGYKPCGRSTDCSTACEKMDLVEHRVLLIHLGAMGAVVRSTSLLKAIKEKYPKSHITWVTDSPMQNLLEGHPLVDRIIVNNPQGHITLGALAFDVAMVIDKSLQAAGLLKLTKVDKVFGFINDAKSGAAIPATPAAFELWELGLNDEKKFFVNQKPETQLITEALELPYNRHPYFLHLTDAEKRETKIRRFKWINDSLAKRDASIEESLPLVVGINTGCGPLMPAKKLTVQFHRKIISRLLTEFNVVVVLLGGPEDTLRNQAIGAGLNAVQTATDQGLRDGLVSINACDVVITGDSLGMHLAIAMEKEVIAWFGPSCAHEIDLFDRGSKILTAAPCSPCWKRSCQKDLMCYDQVNLEEIVSQTKLSLNKMEVLKNPPTTQGINIVQAEHPESNIESIE